MLENQKMLSVNQQAGDKVGGNVEGKTHRELPVNIEFRATNENKMETRGATSGKGKDMQGKSYVCG